MKKQWIKTGDFKYRFEVGDREEGKMEIAIATAGNNASISLNGQNYTIRRTGFWKSIIEITNTNNDLIAKTYNKKWYSSTSVLEYNDKEYTIIVRNNPLAEIAILENGKDLLAYGLHIQDNEGNIRITNSTDQNDFLFDFILWYLFFPIAIENTGDNFTFFVLQAQ